MNISLNGNHVVLDQRATVADAVAAAGHKRGSSGVAVAVNGEVVARSSWADTVLEDADKVEVLVASQGG